MRIEMEPIGYVRNEVKDKKRENEIEVYYSNLVFSIVTPAAMLT